MINTKRLEMLREKMVLEEMKFLLKNKSKKLLKMWKKIHIVVQKWQCKMKI